MNVYLWIKILSIENRVRENYMNNTPKFLKKMYTIKIELLGALVLAISSRELFGQGNFSMLLRNTMSASLRVGSTTSIPL